MCEFRPSLGGLAIVVRRERAHKGVADSPTDGGSADAGAHDGISGGDTTTNNSSGSGSDSSSSSSNGSSNGSGRDVSGALHEQPQNPPPRSERTEEGEEPAARPMDGDGSPVAPSSSSSPAAASSSSSTAGDGSASRAVDDGDDADGDADILLQSKIDGDEMFERQGESIIMWREADDFHGGDVDYALSFQVRCGVWVCAGAVSMSMCVCV